MLNIDKFIFVTNKAKVNPSVHLPTFNKQYLILAKFYVNSAQSIGNQSAKFQLNLSTQTIVTAAFVRSF